MSYALIAIVATLIAANIATAYQLWRTMRDFAAEMVALAQSDADLMIARSNEETAIRAAKDATELVDALRASNAEERSKQDAIETDKINRATDGASLVVAGVSVWKSMPGPTAPSAAKRVIEAVQAAAIADRDSSKRKR
jgi:hypothetical protein